MMSNTCEKVMLNEENSYHTIDYSIDGKRFVVAGLLRQIEFYDVETRKPLMKLTKDQNKCHNNKIFSVKHGALNPN
jgi:WD40 repeat protein